MNAMSAPHYPPTVKLVEVGPRDGLQNEPRFLDTATKVEFIRRLAESGLPVIEVASFVHPEAVPQLADAEAVCGLLKPRPGVRYTALCPNLQGLERALAAGVGAIAVFTAASETFNQKNIRCGIEESLRRIAPVVERARAAGLPVRAYISCVLGCPYEGPVSPERVASLAGRLHELGCEEIALGDTIGAGTPLAACCVVEATAHRVPLGRIAVHFHDTRGQALANILACLGLGVSIIDTAVAGLGGCPYAPGASGNVATEDVAYMLRGMGIETGVDLARLIETGRFISAALGRDNRSRVGQAGGGPAVPAC
jgi:hydroxymethylglutaryl-CoA lyase